MRPEEKIDLVRKVRELAPKDKLVLAGSGCEGKKTRTRKNTQYDLFNFVCILARENLGLKC